MLNQSLECFLSLLSFEEILEGKLLIQCDEEDDKEYLLLNGICRTFVNNYEEKQKTLTFYAGAENLIQNYFRTTNGTSTLNIQALTDIQIATISIFDLKVHLSENHQFREWKKKCDTTKIGTQNGLRATNIKIPSK